MNCAPNRSTKSIPFQVVFGNVPRITEFDNVPEIPRGHDVSEYLVNRAKVTKLLFDKIRICQSEADSQVHQKGPYIEPERLEHGDLILLRKEFSAVAKRTHLKYLGPYTVVRSNGHVVLICDDDGTKDWVHRSSVIKKTLRRPNLGILPYFPNLAIPLPSTLPDPIRTENPLVDPLPDNIHIPVNVDDKISDSENVQINPNASLNDKEESPENTSLPDPSPEENRFFDCGDHNQSKNPLNPIPKESENSTGNNQLSTKKGILEAPERSAQPKLTTSRSRIGAKFPNPRLPNPTCSKPVTRRQAQRLSEEVESDRDLARRLQKEELRRSARHSPY